MVGLFPIGPDRPTGQIARIEQLQIEAKQS